MFRVPGKSGTERTVNSQPVGNSEKGARNVQTPSGYTGTSCGAPKKKRGQSTKHRGGIETDTGRGPDQEEGVKNSQQPERVTECSPGRESVWVNVRAAPANASVSLNQ